MYSVSHEELIVLRNVIPGQERTTYRKHSSSKEIHLI
uniref:Uncharacterized protein n=1 Tax=Anguilla anguilla TaxID=7936 RepID=A0A0E9S0Z0_ANGAN